MSTIAELTIPAAEFALRRTLEAADDLAVDVERVVAYDPDCIMPHVWFGGEPAALAVADDALADDPTVETAELLSDLEDERLYRIRWSDRVADVVLLLTRERATILDAGVERERWRFRVLFPDRESLSRSYDAATDRGTDVEIRKIHRLEEERRGGYGLTDAQHETLVEALERGYYEIPREIDMEHLSDELDISHQALSERLRRAHRALVAEAIDLDDREPDDG